MKRSIRQPLLLRRRNRPSLFPRLAFGGSSSSSWKSLRKYGLVFLLLVVWITFLQSQLVLQVQQQSSLSPLSSFRQQQNGSGPLMFFPSHGTMDHGQSRNAAPVAKDDTLPRTHSLLKFSNDTTTARTTTTSLVHSMQDSEVSDLKEDVDEDKESTTPIEEEEADTTSEDDSVIHSRTHFIIFQGGRRGQGAGNHLQGLLAAHLFGLEFNRTVCLIWDAFWEAFDYANTDHAALCRSLEARFVNKTETQTTKEFRTQKKDLILWNFGSTDPDECVVRETLTSRQILYVSFSGNTYPGWRSEIPPSFFHRFYRPRPALLQALPYYNTNTPENDYRPRVVVHLRYPDGGSDRDRGLDDESLEYLGHLLKGNGTYLVTNRIDWYERFQECCGWSFDPAWVGKRIRHGAMDITWGPNGETTKKNKKTNTTTTTTAENVTSTTNTTTTTTETKENQNLKLWSDWYTMHTADKVYHSNSDFSRSAVHWNSNCIGYQLGGMQTQRVHLTADDTNHSSNGLVSTNNSSNSSTHGTNNTSTGRFVEKRVLILNPAPYDAVSTRIPPLVERLVPTTYSADPTCVHLRFCRYLVPAKNTTNQNRRIRPNHAEARLVQKN